MNQEEVTDASKIVVPLPLIYAATLAIICATASVIYDRVQTDNRIKILENGVKDRWTRQDEIIQALQTKLRNPDFVVVDPRDQTKTIQIGNQN